MYKYLKRDAISNRSFNFSKCDFGGLNSYFNSFDWDLEFENRCLSEMYNRFAAIMKFGFTTFVPCSVKRNISKPPWYNRRLLHLKNLKTKAYKRFKISGNVTDKDLFWKLRKDFTVLSKFLHNLYINSVENKLKRDCKSVWSFINHKRCSIGLPKTMVYKNVESNDTYATVELFAQFFESVFSKCSVPSSLELYSMSKIDFGLLVLELQDVQSAARTLKPNSKPGADGVPAIVLKTAVIPCVHLCSQFLMHLFHLAFFLTIGNCRFWFLFSNLDPRITLKITEEFASNPLYQSFLKASLNIN